MDRIEITPRQRRFASATTDVLVYTIALNLFVEYVEAVVIESFTISLLVAVVLKVLLDLIVAAEHRVGHYFTRFDHPAAKALRLLTTWLILFLSKFVILGVIDLIFGESVELGGFFLLVALVLVMMVARAALDLIYRTLGAPDRAAS